MTDTMNSPIVSERELAGVPRLAPMDVQLPLSAANYLLRKGLAIDQVKAALIDELDLDPSSARQITLLAAA